MKKKATVYGSERKRLLKFPYYFKMSILTQNNLQIQSIKTSMAFSPDVYKKKLMHVEPQKATNSQNSLE